MKKTEQLRSGYGSPSVANGTTAPAAPAPGMNAVPSRRSADPSSAVRSRYPEPSIGFRMRPAE